MSIESIRVERLFGAGPAFHFDASKLWGFGFVGINPGIRVQNGSHTGTRWSAINMEVSTLNSRLSSSFVVVDCETDSTLPAAFGSHVKGLLSDSFVLPLSGSLVSGLNPAAVDRALSPGRSQRRANGKPEVFRSQEALVRSALFRQLLAFLALLRRRRVPSSSFATSTVLGSSEALFQRGAFGATSFGQRGQNGLHRRFVPGKPGLGSRTLARAGLFGRPGFGRNGSR
jgi:hypothetical protein